jgi:hypothetical protein
VKQTNPSPRRKPGEPSRDCKGAEQTNPSPRRKPGKPSRDSKGAEQTNPSPRRKPGKPSRDCKGAEQTNPSPRRKPGEPSRDCKGAEQANPSPRRKPGEPSRARKGAETGEVPSGIKSPFEQAPHTTNPPPPKRICPNRPRMFKCNHRRWERHRNRAPPPGPIAQRLEQSTHNRLVRGSNPCGPNSRKVCQ